MRPCRVSLIFYSPKKRNHEYKKNKAAGLPMGGACGNFHLVNGLMGFRSNRSSGDGRHDRKYRSKHLAAGFTQSD